MDMLGLPKNAEIASKVIDAQHTTRKMEMGLLGKLFGGGSEKNGNIAGFVLIISFGALGLIAYLVPSLVEQYAREIVTAIFSLITLTVGYIFGQKSSS